MEEEKLFDLDEDFTLFRTHKISDEIVRFAENTLFGTQENLYWHYHFREYATHTRGMEFILLRNKDNELMGMMAFSIRKLDWDPPFEGAYLRYYAASPKIRGKRLVGRFSMEYLEWWREHQIVPMVLYGTVESKNKASRAIGRKLGFESIAPIKLMGFSRFYPRKKGDVQRVSAEEWKQLLPELDALYSEHAFWGHDYLNLHNDYYVLKKDGKIVCGAQLHHGHWMVKKMSGFIGRYLLPVLPYVPLMRNIFNPRAFRFLTFEGIYYEKGYEGEAANLFETLLFLKKYHTAMVWFDGRDPLYRLLIGQKNLGLFSRFTRNINISLEVDFTCFPKEQADKLRNARYCYPSGYDHT